MAEEELSHEIRQAEANGDQERIDAMQDRLRQAQALIDQQKECRRELWANDVEIQRNPMAPPPLPAPANNCSCELQVLGHLSVNVPVRHIAIGYSNDDLELTADCMPAGGTYTWELIPSGTPNAELVSDGRKASFTSFEKGLYHVKVMYTDPNMKMCEMRYQIQFLY